MSVPRLAPTRLNLLRAARRLDRVAKGTSVLRRKREALVSELFKIARPAADARTVIAERARTAYPALLGALALHGAAGLRAVGWPARDLTVELAGRSVWGVAVGTIERRPPMGRTLAARGLAPGSTGPAAVRAATEFEALAELLLEAAPREMLIRRLGAALARTSRQVNTLERRLAPGLEGQIAVVRRALEEREREEHLRLKHLGRRRGGTRR
jgi:V/A-type H+-transporting ATPase subunit D